MLYAGTAMTVMPASACSLVRIVAFIMIVGFGIFFMSATDCGTTTGAPGLRSFATASASKWSP